MCGIYLSVSVDEAQNPSLDLRRRLEARGPDSAQTARVTVPGVKHGPLDILVFATVLALRGDGVTVQPLQNKGVLAWNGEAWFAGGERVSGNDTHAVFELLENAAREDAGTRHEHDDTAVLTALRSIQGAFAFVYVDMLNACIYVGRDFFGKRSLLIRNDANALCFSSIADDCGEWHECNANEVLVLRARTETNGEVLGVPGLRCTTHALSATSLSLNVELPADDLDVDNAIMHASEELEALLRKSLKKRILPITAKGARPCAHARLAVLFSGGLDCSVIARLAHEFLPQDEPIDLLNVAFENPRVHGKASKESSVYELCPDRETARRALAEIQAHCPGRPWRLRALDIPYTETLAHRPLIKALIHPHNTEMDLSIGCALYFAARADQSQHGASPRILLSGLGADELFGGYGRHRAAVDRHADRGEGFRALFDELQSDVSRLGKRNLGRDDRAMANWAREVRYPYLDDALVQWAVAQPFWNKCPFTLLENGDVSADKRVLRTLARRLGLEGVAKEKKRAIQFGARTAKMEVGKTRGTDTLV